MTSSVAASHHAHRQTLIADGTSFDTEQALSQRRFRGLVSLRTSPLSGTLDARMEDAFGIQRSMGCRRSFDNLYPILSINEFVLSSTPMSLVNMLLIV